MRSLAGDVPGKLRRVMGAFNVNGSAITGGGDFIATKTATGTWTVRLREPFRATPSVAAAAASGGLAYNASVGGLAADSFNVYAQTCSTNAAVDTQMTFIAEGMAR